MAHMQQKVVKTCQVHSHKQLTIYCFDCKRAICFACYNEDHQEHKCDDVISAARDTKAGMLEQCQAIRGTSLPTLSANIEATKADEDLSSQNLENHLGEIDAVEEDAIRTLKEAFSKHRKDAKDKHETVLSKAKDKTQILEHLYSEIDRRTKTLEEEFTVLPDFDILELNQELKDKLVIVPSKTEKIPIYDARIKAKTLSITTVQLLTDIVNEVCATESINIRRKGSSFLGVQMVQRSKPPPKSDMAFARYHPSGGCSQKKVVASLNIGSRFCGFLYSSKDEPHKYFSKTWMANWLIPGARRQTDILFNANLQVEFFGYDAEYAYASLKEEGTSDDFYFINNIKAPLFEGIAFIPKDGKEKLPVQMLWKETINSLIEFLQQHCKKEYTTNVKIDHFDIVISLPSFLENSIWDFVRDAALQTGLKNDQLLLISEAEAASVFTDLEPTKEEPQLRDGNMMIVVDIGLSTKLDCLRKTGNIFVEVVKPAVVNIGGQSVTEAFEIFIEGILGLDLYQRYKATYPEDYLDLLHEFEFRKSSFRPSTSQAVLLRLPMPLIDFLDEEGTNLGDLLAVSNYRESVVYRGGKLRILESTLTKVIFSDVIDCITKHVMHFIDVNRLRDITTMILVGGFAECSLLQDEFKGTFHEQRLHIPADSGLATLKGGVLFGHYYAPSKRS